jgi:dihydrodipicolinate synthase/N-acetylneuraminate lyase
MDDLNDFLKRKNGENKEEKKMMKNGKLVGVVPPMITPFDPNGELDKEALINLVNFLKKHVHGLFVCGSYGSGAMMSIDQRKECCEIVVEQVGGTIPVVCHVGAAATKTAVLLAKHAEKAGVSRVASVPPFYFKHTEEELIRFYAELVEAVNIPVYIYNNPRASGHPVSVPLLQKLADVGVVGIKDSSSDLMLFANFMRKMKPEFDIVVGTEAVFLPASALGARAFIPGVANAFPELLVEFHNACMNAYKEGDYTKVRRINNRVLAVRDIMYRAGSGIVGVHEMLKMRGLDGGLPQPPYYPVDEKIRREMQESLKEMGVI